MDERLCRVEAALGRREACPETGCPFWSAGVRACQDHCTLEGLDFAGRAEFAQLLHELRFELAGDDDTRRRYYERLNAGRSD
jgi:hypothetical protein